MEYETILNENGQFEGIKTLSTGQFIKRGRHTDLGNNLIISVDRDILDLFDLESKALFKILYHEMGNIGCLAKVRVVATNNIDKIDTCEIIQDVNKVKVLRSGIDLTYSTDILENENVEMYTQMMLDMFNHTEFINTNSSFQAVKSIIMQYAQEQATKMIKYKYENAPKVTKLIEEEKVSLNAKLKGLTNELDKTLLTTERERILDNINKLNSQMLSYDNTIAQIQTNGRKMNIKSQL